MTETTNADLIDLLAGILPGDTLAGVRDQRTQARENAQRSFSALLEPAEPGSFPLRERYAIALFVAQLHRFTAAEAFYADVLGDEAPELVTVIRGLNEQAASHGPVGAYREPGLYAESVLALPWEPDTVAAGALGTRLAAAFTHTHLLVFRPREATPAALAALVDAGWSADDVVSLSQLVSFLAFQLRAAWGLRALSGASKGRTATGPAAHIAPQAASTSPAGTDFSARSEDLITSYPDLNRPHAFTQDSLGWVPWLAPVPETELTAEQREALIDPQRAKMPYFRLLARDPQALHARTLTDLDIFFNVTGGIGRAERELAATAASRHNGCVFCASVHSAAATRESAGADGGGRGDSVQRLLDEGISADLGDPVWNAIVRASVSLTNTPLAFGEPDVAALRAVGLDDAEIVDVINGAAFFNWANRLMLSLGEPEVPARRARA